MSWKKGAAAGRHQPS